MLQKPDSCRGCPLFDKPHGKSVGWTNPDGTGDNGVLLVLEASGEAEERSGIPVVGKAGYYLFENLKRAGIEREGFRIANVLSCRPPNNKLAGMSYEAAAVAHCAPNLDAVIRDMQARCKASGKTFTIVTLGRTAFLRVMGFDTRHPIVRDDYMAYPFWNEKYQAWIYATFHPSYLMRGYNHLLPVLQFTVKRAVEVATGGLTLATPQYLLDPGAATFDSWIKDYVNALERDPSIYLSYDIETPMKQGKDEEKVSKESDDDYSILRVSFAYRSGEAISVPWQGEYLAGIEYLFSLSGAKVGWNADNYDLPRVRAQMAVNGDHLDGMLMWHVLNSALPKGLGFVTPFYCQDVEMWKHLSGDQPAFYNAKDSDMALRNIVGIERDLRNTNLWEVFDRHVVQLNRVLAFMSNRGLLRDEVARNAAEVKLSALMDGVETSMEAAVPQEARKFQVYKKAPKVTEGLVQVPGKVKVSQCGQCESLGVKAAHFASVGKKRLKKGEAENPCVGLKATKVEVETLLWAKPLDFKVSVKSLSNYQKFLRHQAIVNRRENRITFDEDAIKTLTKRYPKDPLYPAILKHREYQKLLSTYVGVTDSETGILKGGIRVGRDGRIHPQFTHNPSTLRMACQNPNMQNLPRASKDPNSLQTIVRNLVIASPGHLLVEFDYSAIEAVLVGYFAGLPDYIRLSKMGIHSYLASHVLKRPADLTWSDRDLKAYFKEIKGSKDPHTNLIYNGCKRAIHLTGYGGTARKMVQAEPETFPTVKYAEELQAIYFGLFPAIKRWQLSCQMQAEKEGFLRNPFGYVHRFSKVFSYTKESGKWVRKQGDDANRVLAFLPQSTAAGMIKEAMLRLFYDRFEEAGQYLRLQVHDSLVSDVPDDEVERASEAVQTEMERPVPELRLPQSYGMGDALVVETERKVGLTWGKMS